MPALHFVHKEGLAVKATLRVHLDQLETPESRKGVVGWVEEHIGEREKQVDSMTAADFLSSVGAFLERTGVKSVYDVWFDHDVVYRASKDRERQDNHEEALKKAAVSAKTSHAHLKELGIWSHGTSHDFYLEFRLRFRRVHDVGAAPLILEIQGNPVELTDPTGHNEFELEERLRLLEESKARVEKKNAQVGRRFEARLKELQGILKQTFRVKDISQDLKIDVGSIW